MKPTRTLTVTDGRDTVGFINEYGSQRFTALFAKTGEKLGPFKSSADAAQALSTAAKQAEDRA